MLLDAKAEALVVQLPTGCVVIDAGDKRRLVAGCGTCPFESRLKRWKLVRIDREFESGFEHDTSAVNTHDVFMTDYRRALKLQCPPVLLPPVLL